MTILSNLGGLAKSLGSGNTNQIDEIVTKVHKNVDDMEKGGANTTDLSSLKSMLKLINTLRDNLRRADTVQDDPQDDDEDNKLFFIDYNDRLKQGLTELSDPDALAKLKNDVELERVYIGLLNGKKIPDSNSHSSLLPGCECPQSNNQSNKQSNNQQSEIFKYREQNADPPILNNEGKEQIRLYVMSNIQRQQDIHLVSLQLDLLLKRMYLHQETELLDTMLEQQEALVRGLSDWSDYLDQQTHEYAEMYEKMDALISTQRRKSSFTVRDIQSLEKWTYGSHVVFWILVASGFLMVIVYNFTSIQKVTESVDKNLNKLRQGT